MARYSPKNLMGRNPNQMTQKKSETGDLLRDTLDMLILKTLTRGEMHGYDIAEYLEERSDQVLGVEEGALYPALHRLEVRGLLAAEWGASDNNRRAKYYRLTAAGRKQLAEETAHWKRMSSAIARILEPA
jgi:PadR family transcriptional regulator PadR